MCWQHTLTGWIFVSAAIRNDSLSVFLHLSFKTVNATCNVLPHLPTSAFTGSAVYVLLLVSQQSLSLSRCFLQWHPESRIIRKIILAVCLNFFFKLCGVVIVVFVFFCLFVFYGSRNILDSVRYSTSITEKINKPAFQTRPWQYWRKQTVRILSPHSLTW